MKLTSVMNLTDYYKLQIKMSFNQYNYSQLLYMKHI